MHKLTLIFNFRNRDLDRVRRCLTSLKNQTCKDFSVVFINYGSELALSDEVKKVVEEFSFCKYFYNDTRGKLWNKSHSINTAIRVIESEYFMTTDIDLIYSKNFISNVIERLTPETEVHSLAYTLPRKFSDWENIENHKFTKRQLSALGLAQGVLTKHIFDINGYDEFYTIYGVEDTDITSRLELKGIKTDWMDLVQVKVYHQWHPHFVRNSNKKIPGGWINFLEEYFNKNKNKLIRNENKFWGQLDSIDNRPALQLALDTSKIIKEFVVSPIGISYSILELNHYLAELSAGEAIRVLYEDKQKYTFQNSNVYKLISTINKLVFSLNLTFKSVPDIEFFKDYVSTYDLRDALIYLITYNQNSITDYYLEVDDEKLILIIVK